MTQLSESEARSFAENKLYEKLSEVDRFEFQMIQDRLCMPFSEFHRCAEIALGRPVFTHEFAYRDHLIAEYKKEKPMSTFADVIALIPKEKAIIVSV